MPIVVVVTIAFPLCFQGRTRDPVNQFVPTSPAKTIAAPIKWQAWIASPRQKYPTRIAITVDRFRKSVSPAEVSRFKARLANTVVRSDENRARYRIAVVNVKSENGVKTVAQVPWTAW